MNSNQQNFGNYRNQEIQLFTLENDNGVTVKITNYGATITSVEVPNKNGVIEDITCGFDSLEGYFSEDYKENAPYFGSTVGRYTSQIKNSSFVLDGVQYDLAKNCGDNNLHGGAEGFDKKIWDANFIHVENAIGIEMSLLSKDMEEGYPGNLQIVVLFVLNNSNELAISYRAITDKKTPLSLTNHTYFNLSGFNASVEEHSVLVKAGNKLAMDETGAATGSIVNLDDEVDDLRTSKTIKLVHENMNDGFEHYYIFDKNNFMLQKVAEFGCQESGRSLEVSTSEPGMLFYTGKYTSDKLKRESGAKFGKYRGFCCETHRYPNGPNIQDAPKVILNVEEEFKSTTVFKFSW